MTPDGLFVSVEGVDGSGKSTQARLLAHALRASGREVVLTREPGGSPGAEEVRRLLLTGEPDRWSPMTELLLFTAARRDHLERTILPALGRGAVVVSDRFADSTRVYQGTGREDLREAVDRLHETAIRREPDLTLVLDMDPRIGLSRSLARLAAQEAAQAAPIAAAPAAASAELDAVAVAGGVAGTAARARAATTAVEAGLGPEDRFESFGPLFQERLREGFLGLAAQFPERIAVVDAGRPESAVAQDVLALVTARL